MISPSPLLQPAQESDWMEVQQKDTSVAAMMLVSAARSDELLVLLIAPHYRDAELSDLVYALHAQYFLDSNSLFERLCQM